MIERLAEDKAECDVLYGRKMHAAVPLFTVVLPLKKDTVVRGGFVSHIPLVLMGGWTTIDHHGLSHQ